MKHFKIPVLKFNELDENARQFAINAQGDINTDHNWWDWVYEDANKIELSVSDWNIEGRPWAKGQFLNTPATVAALIIREHGDKTETYLLAKQYQLNSEFIAAKYKEAPDEKAEEGEYNSLDEAFLKDILYQYAQMLKSDYEYRTSGAAIIETIEANDYDFMADGELWSEGYAATIKAEEVN